ncbi:MAG: adenylate/guanylate cyclase domain-containing protein [Myxococcota bacterium]
MAANSDSDSVIANPLRASGLVDAGAIEKGRSYVREHGGLLSDALLRLELVKEGDFLRTFAELYSTRFVKAEKLKTLRLDPTLLDRLGVRMAERLRMCPIRWDESAKDVHVVAAVPLSSSLEPELRQVLGARTVSVYVASAGGVSALIKKAYYQQHDAFDQVTANGAGPQLTKPVDTNVDDSPFDHDEPTAQRPEPTVMVSLDQIANPEEVKTTDRAPGADREDKIPTGEVLAAEAGGGSTDGKTVMVNLEALTIATLRRENARYRIAQEFHRRVTLERSVEAMVDRLLSVIFELLPADGAAVWLTTGQYASKAKAGDRRIEVPRAVIDQALSSPNGLLAHNALVDERFDRSQSVMMRGVKSVMAVPMRAREKVIGILYVESVSMSAAFTDEDVPLLDAIASQAAILLDNAALVTQVQREVETRASLSRFLSQAAVDEVLSGRMKVNMEGHLEEITVLFADIRGFTNMSAHMRPEEVVRFLNAFFAEAVDAVERHGGIVDKFIGDCVMGLWGAVGQREDHARNAITAAMELVERGARIRVQGEPLQVGVGINTGQAVVGAIGAQRRLDYTAIGATVNLSARLCGIAAPNEVLITSDTLMRAGPGVIAAPGEAVILKGLDVPIVPYAVRSIAQPLQLKEVAPPKKIGHDTVPSLPSPLKPK